MFFTLIFFLLAIILLLATSSPSAFIEKHRFPATINPSIYSQLGYQQTSFSLQDNPVLSIQINELRSINRFLSLHLIPVRTHSHRTDKKISIQAEVSAFSLTGDEIRATIFEKKDSRISFNCKSGADSSCIEERILQVPISDLTDFYFVINFLNYKELEESVESFEVISDTLNPSYQFYIFSVKLIFLLITIVCLYLHSARLKGLDKGFRTLEQRVFPVLAMSLVLVNQPLGALVFTGGLYAFLMTIVLSWFNASLLWYWLNSIYSLAGSDSSVFEKKSKFVKYYAIWYSFAISLTNFVLYIKIQDEPTFESHTWHSGFFSFLEYVVYLTLIVGVVWVVLKGKEVVLRIKELSDREAIIFWVSGFFMFVHLYMIAKSYFSPISWNGSGTILFCGVSTLYILIMNYAFLPTDEGLGQAQHMKKYDNPEVKDSYKDLEASEDTKDKKNQYQQEDSSNDGKRGESAESPQTGNGLAYPYESQEDEEL